MSKTYAIENREYVLQVRDLPQREKPREKLIAQGPEVLSTRELISVLLCTGTSKEGVMEMSERMVNGYGEKNVFSRKDASKLALELSIPIVKACQIVASGELGRRMHERSENDLPTIRSAKDANNYLRDMGSLSKENLRGLYLNSRNRIIRDEVISIGTMNASLIHPREVFRSAIECNAVAIVLAHNHPSGDAHPSDEDIRVTEQLIEAGKIVGISVLDHIIITKKTFASVKVNYN